jgi:hypothetical protein
MQITERRLLDFLPAVHHPAISRKKRGPESGDITHFPCFIFFYKKNKGLSKT